MTMVAPRPSRRLKDQIVEPAGGDRIEAGGRFVEEQNVGVQRQRPRQTCPFAHAAAEFGRKLVDRVLHADQTEFQPHQAADGGVVDSRVNIRNGSATFSPTVSALHSAPLWNSTPNRRPIAVRRASVPAQ